MTATAVPALPPAKDIDEAQEALTLRKRFRKQLFEKLSPESRQWVVAGLAQDLEQATK